MTRVSQGQWKRRGVRDQEDARTRVGGEGHRHLGDVGRARGRPEVSLVTVRRQPSRTQPGTHRAQSTGGSPVPTAAGSAAGRP